MDAKTLEYVMSLGPDADAVVRWAIKLEGILHSIEEYDSGDDARTVAAIKTMARQAFE